MRRGERFNAITHLVGAALALAGLVVLLIVSGGRGQVVEIVSFAIYGASLLLLYVMSTLYHSFSGRRKALFRRFDHMAVYLLIAGTYTPITLVLLRGGLAWVLFATVWSLALVGVVHSSLRKDGGGTGLQTIICLAMGWLCMFGLEPIRAAFPPGGFSWLVAGGIFYSMGVIFFVFDHRIPHGHGIWHLFTLAGSVSHYVMILGYVGV